jgi:hypothetical protein
MATCPLSFSLRPAVSANDLLDACGVRARAYGHHMADFRHAFAQPDAIDHSPGTTVFLCRDKASGDAVGTARIQCSSDGPLPIENSVLLPRWLQGQTRAEITRLSVPSGGPSQAKLLLMKAAYFHCRARQTRWMVIGARNEALIRNYRRLGFIDVFGADDWVPLAHAGNLPHQILAFDVDSAEAAWRSAGHPLYGFMIDTVHPDLHPLPQHPDLLPTSRPLPAAA